MCSTYQNRNRSRRAGYSGAAVALALILIGLSAPAASANPAYPGGGEPPKIDILSPSKLHVSADEESEATILLRNSGDSPLVVGLEVIGEYAPTMYPKSTEVLDNKVKTVSVWFTPTTAGKEVHGELVTSGINTAPFGIPFEATSSKDVPWWLYAVVLGCFAAALAFLLVRLFRNSQLPRSNRR